jgi:hypothetical protein
MSAFRKLHSIYFIVLIALFTACSEDDSLEADMTSDEVVEILEVAMQSATGGLTQNIDTVVVEIEDISLQGICDSTYVMDVNYSYEDALRTAAYTSVLTFDMQCNLLSIPQSASFDFSSLSSYATPRLTSDDQSVFSGTMNGLAPSSAYITMAASYERNGTNGFVLKNKNIASKIQMTLTEIKFEKASSTIVSGAGTFQITGAYDGNDFSYSGTIVFNGDKTATITIDGESVIISL